jgi:hypothetical protein
MADGAVIVVSGAWVAILAGLSLDRLGIRRVPAGGRLHGYGMLRVTLRVRPRARRVTSCHPLRLVRGWATVGHGVPRFN